MDMNLNPRESVLVALGAAIGSNCIACIEHLVPQARQAGLTEREIRAAIQQADQVRQVPARKALQAAMGIEPRPSCGPFARETENRMPGAETGSPAPQNGRGCC